ncbi:MAG: hypothetical protein ABII26_12220 [Pseudomonadota bacterium]
MRKKKPEKEVTLIGYIEANEWDHDDDGIAIGISTIEDDYLVEQNSFGQELLDFIDEKVEVTGILKEDKDGTKRIRVTVYEILESYEDYWDGGVDEDENDEEDFDPKYNIH